MKKSNKAVTYLLIAAVVAIWGIAIYRVYKVSGPNNTENSLSGNFAKPETSNAQLDTFSLIASYRDPFVIKYTSVNIAADLNLEEEKAKKVVVKPIVTWPEIKYGGTVKNKVSEKKVALVNINEQNHLLAVGDTAQEIRVMAIYADSLMLFYKSELKAVVRSKEKLATEEEEPSVPANKKKK